MPVDVYTKSASAQKETVEREGGSARVVKVLGFRRRGKSLGFEIWNIKVMAPT
jgi:hypothetical protein